MSRRRASLILAAALVALEASAVAAHADPGHVRASLVAETRNITPGQTIRIALRQEIEPGWHTYWSNPGDSGLPTTIEWRLPPGFSAAPIGWPTPQRITYGPIVDYGYEHEVWLTSTIAVPRDIARGAKLTLAAHAGWLVCSDTCIPEEADLALSLPVGTEPDVDRQAADALAAASVLVPRPDPFRESLAVSGDELMLRIAMGDATHLGEVTFFPLEEGVIDAEAPQLVSADASGLTLTLKRDLSKPIPPALNGVLAFVDAAAEGGGKRAFAIAAPLGAPAPGAVGGPELGIAMALVLALAGGIVLNLMPCVLPILSIKVLALVQHSGATPATMRRQGLAYAAGVLASFAAIAAALNALRAAGAAIGWGFQLQSPLFVAAMAYLLFAVGLNLSGVFSFGSRLGGVGSGFAARPGYAGAFFAGTLATLVATPCTAPFMASAVGFAVTQPWPVSLAIFEALALGLALPYLLAAWSPGLRRYFPKPGAWMLRLKQFLAFPVYGTAVWLVLVLSREAGEAAVGAVLGGAVLIGFAAWLYDAAETSGRLRALTLSLSAAGALGALMLLLVVDAGDASGGAESAADSPWQPWSRARVEQLRAQGTPVFVDFTAAWCITCKVNEHLALEDRGVRQAFAETGVAMLKADWTRRDPEITRELEANGRAGVPLYLFYPARGRTPSPVILPQLLTAEAILREVKAD